MSLRQQVSQVNHIKCSTVEFSPSTQKSYGTGITIKHALQGREPGYEQLSQLSNQPEVSPLRVSRVVLQTRQPGPGLQAAPLCQCGLNPCQCWQDGGMAPRRGARLFRKHPFCRVVCTISVLTTNVPSSLPRPREN